MSSKVRTLKEVEDKISRLADYAKIQQLESFIKAGLDSGVEIHCRAKLLPLYEDKRMFSEAAKNANIIAGGLTTFLDKLKMNLKEAELWVKAEQYERADMALKKTMASANQQQGAQILEKFKGFYKKQALEFEKINRRAHAIKVYEKLLTISNNSEKEKIKSRLLELYGKTARLNEYRELKKTDVSRMKTEGTFGHEHKEKSKSELLQRNVRPNSSAEDFLM